MLGSVCVQSTLVGNNAVLSQLEPSCTITYIDNAQVFVSLLKTDCAREFLGRYLTFGCWSVRSLPNRAWKLFTTATWSIGADIIDHFGFQILSRSSRSYRIRGWMRQITLILRTLSCSRALPSSAILISFPSLVPRPIRAIRVTRGGLEPSAIARGLAKNREC